MLRSQSPGGDKPRPQFKVEGVHRRVWSGVDLFQKRWTVSWLPMRDVRGATPVKQSTPSAIWITRHHKWKEKNDKHLKSCSNLK